MAADAAGNDIQAVGIPITGNIGFAPVGTAGPTPAEGASRSFTLDPAFRKPGLQTEDGGFEWTLEADGDPITFWQDGYSLSTGLATAELVLKLAQTDEIVRSIIRGKTADANGYMTIDAGGTDTQYSVFTEEIFKNRVIRRRWAPVVGIKSVKEDKNERGNVLGYEVTVKIERSPLVNNEHFGEWLIPGDTVEPVIVAATPSGAAASDTVTITGTGFTGATGVKFGASNATSFQVVSASSITAVVPAGSAGSAQITVSTPNGNATFAYTRG
ncbi:IPT/TIG domain-containing protein [Paeniglutamicibacter sp. R2-26]|uniref:phage tail tube protein n=1 Tax=Paeniglutamicibacter sp. R2-26 TaxID=3144417 RepID=UPI003EE55695